MRTFYIASTLLILLIIWLVNKPLDVKLQVAHEFNDAEISYLEKSFDYAMDNLKKDEIYEWSVAGVNGRIAASEKYQSKQKADCRNYVEVSRTIDSQKVESGISCKRQGKEGWCRISEENPASCALEVAESSLAKRARFAILKGNQAIDDLLGTKINVNTSKLAPSKPTRITIPSLGPLPEIESPDFEPSDLRPPMPWDK